MGIDKDTGYASTAAAGGGAAFVGLFMVAALGTMIATAIAAGFGFICGKGVGRIFARLLAAPAKGARIIENCAALSIAALAACGVFFVSADRFDQNLERVRQAPLPGFRRIEPLPKPTLLPAPLLVEVLQNRSDARARGENPDVSNTTTNVDPATAKQAAAGPLSRLRSPIEIRDYPVFSEKPWLQVDAGSALYTVCRIESLADIPNKPVVPSPDTQWCRAEFLVTGKTDSRFNPDDLVIGYAPCDKFKPYADIQKAPVLHPLKMQRSTLRLNRKTGMLETVKIR